MSDRSREVREVIDSQSVMEGAGVKLKRSFPTRSLDYLDPFLLFDHFGSDDPADYLAGFPMHPHRGIETVTYLLAGEVEHMDSLGNGGVIGAGDLQWMTSGGGIMHEEMPRPVDGKMEGFQLWVNLPAADKMSRPRYREVASAQIPVLKTEDGVKIRVIAGKADGVQGAVSEIVADPIYLDVSLPAGADFDHPVPAGHTAFAYVHEGEGAFGPAASGEGRKMKGPKLVVFGDGGKVEARTSSSPLRFLLLAGKPIGEPIARYGPFVMNTRQEIEQAVKDLRDDTFIYREE